MCIRDRLEAIQEQVTAAEQEIAALEKQRKALQGNVKLLKAVEKVKLDLDAIQPEKTLTGAVKGEMCIRDRNRSCRGSDRPSFSLLP